MAARLEGRYEAVNQKILVKTRKFWVGFWPPGRHHRRTWRVQHLTGEICFVIVRIRRFTSVQPNSPNVRARKDAYDQRNLSLRSGREHLGRLAVRFCAPYVLQPALQLLRYRVCLLRGD